MMALESDEGVALDEGGEVEEGEGGLPKCLRTESRRSRAAPERFQLILGCLKDCRLRARRCTVNGQEVEKKSGSRGRCRFRGPASKGPSVQSSCRRAKFTSSSLLLTDVVARQSGIPRENRDSRRLSPRDRRGRATSLQSLPVRRTTITFVIDIPFDYS